MAKLSDKQFDRLHTAIEWSNRQLAYPRGKRVSAIKELVGKHYMEGGSQKIMPVNALKLAVDIFVRHLAARNPQAMFSTTNPELKVVAKEFEVAVNQIPEEIDLNRTLRQVVTEAIFSPVGVVKCGLHSSGSIMGHAYGKPFVDCITLDDYFCDLSAKSWDQIQYEGNDYWMEFEDFEETAWTNKKDVKADPFETTGLQGEKQAGTVTANSTADVFRERIWLRDVWLPKEGILVTYGVKSKKIFNVVELGSDTPEPYIRLGFTYVPGNLLALPPIATWRDLNELSNAVFRKLGMSADAYKEVLGFTTSDDANITAFKNAQHGSGMKFTGAKPEKMTAGGIDTKSLAFWLQLKELQSYYGGNYDSTGGLAASTSTIGQDKLLAEAAGAQLRDMSDQTTDFIKKVFKALAYYEWGDPVKTRSLTKAIPGMSDKIPFEWGPGKKRGNFSDYNIEIDAYSRQDKSPQIQLQKLGAVMQQYVLPLAPMIQQAGGMIDVEALMRNVAKYANLPELAEVVTFPADPVQPQQGSTTQQQYIGAPKTPGGGGSGSQGPSQADAMVQQLMSQAE
jgi:hypothetical protein